MYLVQQFINSLIGQFLIGGVTVAAIGFFSNNIQNTALASLIAGIPIALPSTVFVKNADIKNYSKNLVFITFLLFVATCLSYVLINVYEYNKYESVKVSMLAWLTSGILYTLYKTYNK